MSSMTPIVGAGQCVLYESPIVGAAMYYSFILLLDTLHYSFDMSVKLFIV